jgi:hypothetical protein
MNNRKSIKQALEWIQKNSVVDKNGKVKITVDLPYYASKELLTSLTLDLYDLPERTHRRLINSSINRWRKFKKYQNEKDQCKAFFQAIEVEQNILKKKIKHYKVIGFLNINKTILSDLEPILILGDQIKIIDWRELESLKDEEEWKRLWFQQRTNPIFLSGKRDKPLPKFNTFTPVSIEMDTYDDGSAISLFSYRFDIFRSALNLAAIIGNFVYFRGKPTHLSKFLPSPVYLIYKENKLDTFYITIEQYKYKKEKLKSPYEERIDYFLSLYRKPINKTATSFHILALLRLYQDAIDSSLPRPSYLSMWQVVESSVTLPNENLTQDEIISRVAGLLNIDPLYRSTLALLKDIRNRLVHSGEFLDHSDDLFFTLKLIADQIIVNIIRLSKQFPTIEELRQFFRLHTVNDTDLNRIISVIEKINKTRE